MGTTRCNDGNLQRCNQGVQWLTEPCPERFVCGFQDGEAKCVQTECGNGILESGEGCDDGNRVTEVCRYGEFECNVCNANCEIANGTTQYCGDGLINGIEVCDDGNQVTEVCEYGLMYCEVCNAACQVQEGLSNYCGDGLIRADEECDDGNQVTEQCEYGIQNCSVCDASCQITSPGTQATVVMDS